MCTALKLSTQQITTAVLLIVCSGPQDFTFKMTPEEGCGKPEGFQLQLHFPRLVLS